MLIYSLFMRCQSTNHPHLHFRKFIFQGVYRWIDIYIDIGQIDIGIAAYVYILLFLKQFLIAKNRFRKKMNLQDTKMNEMIETTNI